VEIPTNYQKTFVCEDEIPDKGFTGPFFFDLETLPDFQRNELFDLPLVVPYKAEKIDVSPADILGTVDTVKEFLESHQPALEWLIDLDNAEKTGKARKGVLTEIDKAINRIEAAAQVEADNNKKMATTPEMCQIISMGYACGTADEIHSMTVGDILDDGSGDESKVVCEWHILEAFWKMAHRNVLCGYNIAGFDIPVIWARSIILGIPATRKFDLKPWGRDICDLMQKRYPRGSGKLKDLARLYGIEVPAEGVDGGSVLPLWEEDRLDLINEYVQSDVQITRDLYSLFDGYFI